MTRDEIISMAREADLWVAGQDPYQEQIERFAALVAAREREECALTCEHLSTRAGTADECADAIRARAEKETK